MTAGSCVGLCHNYRAKLSPGGRYARGQKRCQRCEVFIKWDGIWCPCCGSRLRLKPRASRYKAKLKERQSIAVA